MVPRETERYCRNLSSLSVSTRFVSTRVQRMKRKPNHTFEVVRQVFGDRFVGRVFKRLWERRQGGRSVHVDIFRGWLVPSVLSCHARRGSSFPERGSNELKLAKWQHSRTDPISPIVYLSADREA